jgi:3-oxoacyl-[acyl-carrier-protein] synthase III
MFAPRRVRFAGMGTYLPSRVVTSSDLDLQLGFPSGFIERKTGVVERRYIEHETTLDMGLAASSAALERAGMQARDLDLIIVAQSVPAQAIPCTAALLQRALEVESMPCLDVNATCLGFLAAVDFAAHAIAAGAYRAVLIVSSEVSSLGLNWQHWESSALFGDGAAAAVLAPTPNAEPSAILTSRMETYSEGADYTTILGGGTLHPPHSQDYVQEMNTFHMDGPRVFRLASQRMGPFLERLHAPLPQEERGCDLLVPHQASLFPIRQLSARFGFDASRVFVNLPTRGNCVAASIPLALSEAIDAGRVVRGSRISLIGSGAGLSLGGMLFIY